MTDQTQFKYDLKRLILEETDKEESFSPEQLDDETPLFGPQSTLQLDSLDALQISVAVARLYNVRIEGSRDGRTAFASINALARFITDRQ